MKILVSDKLANEGLEILKSVKEFQVDCKSGLSPQELKSIIKNYDAIIVRSETKLTADIIQAADKLKVIGRAGVGLDNVDLKAATQKGIVVMNTPGGNTTSTAEHTFSMILALARNIPQAYASMKAGKCERSKFSGIELYGKALGIIGLGRIGRRVADLLAPWRVRILACDPYVEPSRFVIHNCKAVDLPTLLGESDVVSLHVTLTSETRGFFGAKEFAMMKPTAVFINTSRGQAVDEAALAKALAEGRIAAAASDVFEDEPLPKNSPLLKLGHKVLLSPHMATSNARSGLYPGLLWATRSVLRILKGEVPDNVFNTEVIPRWRERFGGKAIC